MLDNIKIINELTILLTGSSPGGDAPTINADEQVISYVPLLIGNPFSSGNIPISMITGGVKVRVNWSVGSYVNVTQRLDITDTHLMQSEYHYDADVVAGVQEQFSGKINTFRYPFYTTISEKYDTMKPNVEQTFDMTGFTGLITSVYIVLKDAHGAFLPISELNLYDGTTSLFRENLDMNFLQATERPHHNEFVQSGELANVVRIPLTDEYTEEAVESGHINGYLLQGTQTNLKFTYKSDSSIPFEANLHVYFTTAENIIINKGLVSIESA